MYISLKFGTMSCGASAVRELKRRHNAESGFLETVSSHDFLSSGGANDQFVWPDHRNLWQSRAGSRKKLLLLKSLVLSSKINNVDKWRYRIFCGLSQRWQRSFININNNNNKITIISIPSNKPVNIFRDRKGMRLLNDMSTETDRNTLKK
jgi:hypothetical protein